MLCAFELSRDNSLFSVARHNIAKTGILVTSPKGGGGGGGGGVGV